MWLGIELSLPDCTSCSPVSHHLAARLRVWLLIRSRRGLLQGGRKSRPDSPTAAAVRFRDSLPAFHTAARASRTSCSSTRLVTHDRNRAATRSSPSITSRGSISCIPPPSPSSSPPSDSPFSATTATSSASAEISRQHMIEFRNVTKYYPRQNRPRSTFCRDVSLTIPGRTNLAVLGPNGAGKSTLLRLIGGAESANSGQIITDANISWPLGLTSGFQGSLTGRKNVLFVCNINGLSRAQARQVIRHVIDFAEIGDYFDMPVNTYSSGMRARLNFGLSIGLRFRCLSDRRTHLGGRLVFRDKAKAAFEDIRRRASLVFRFPQCRNPARVLRFRLVPAGRHRRTFREYRKGIDAYQEYIIARSLASGKSRLRENRATQTHGRKSRRKRRHGKCRKEASPYPKQTPNRQGNAKLIPIR